MAQQLSVATEIETYALPAGALLPEMRSGPSIAEMSQPIPPAVLRLLAQAWQRTGGVSEFEQGFGRATPGPQCYVHALSDAGSESAFSHREIEELRDAGLFDGLAHGPSQARAVNVHAEHALADFCAEVYDAWDRLQGRLEAARAVAARSDAADDAS